MSVLEDIRESDSASSVPGDSYRAAVEAFSDIAEGFAEDGSLTTLLWLIASRTSRLLGVQRCSIYLRQEPGELFRGHVTYIHGSSRDRSIRQLTAGVEADRFTQEIVSTKRPVLVTDARNDPRVVRSAMRAWGVHTLLGLPMLFGGEVHGILFVDNADKPHQYTPEQQQLGAVFANLASVAVINAERAARLRDATALAAQQNQLLRRITAATDALARQLVSSPTLADVAISIRNETHKPCWIYSPTRARRAYATGPDDRSDRLVTPLDLDTAGHEETARMLEANVGEPWLVGPDPRAGLSRQFLVMPIGHGAGTAGHLVIAESKSALSAFDTAFLRRAADLLMSRMTVDRRTTALQQIAEQSLARDLATGLLNAQSLTHRAGVLGVDLLDDHVVCLLSGPETTPLAPADASAAFAAQAPRTRALCVRMPEGILAIFATPPGDQYRARMESAEALVVEAGQQMFGATRFGAAVATARGEPREYADAYASAKVILQHWANTGPVGVRPESQAITARSVGLGSLMAFSPDAGAARRLASDTLGPLVNEPAHEALLNTLRTFIACSCSIRDTADELAVHPNTIRYRMSRIEQLSGLDLVARTDDQLSAQLALLLVRSSAE